MKFRNKEDAFNWVKSNSIDLGDIGSILRSLVGRYTGSSLTNAEREANAFTAQQNQEAMAFEERMADKQMAFQADQAATQWQRGITDMQAAGLNPALAYGQGGASAMSGASGAGHAGSSIAPNTSGLSELLEVLSFKKQMALLDEEIKNKAKDVEVKDAQISATAANESLTNVQALLARKQVIAFDPLNEVTLKNLKQDLKNKEVQARLHEQGIKESQAREALDINNAVLSSMDAATRQELNNLNVRLRIAEIGEVEGRTKRISAEINELYARALVHAANADQLDQMTKNLCVENRILKYDADSKSFQVDHQNADRNWRIAGQVISAVTGAAGVAVGAYTGSAMARNAAANTSINAARFQWQQDISNYRPAPVIGFR